MMQSMTSAHANGEKTNCSVQLTLETNIAIANHHVCVAVVAIRRPSSSVKGANRMHQRAADLNLHGTRFHGAAKQAVKIVFQIFLYIPEFSRGSASCPPLARHIE